MKTDMGDESSQRILDALDIIEKFAGCDGAHHKQWVIDQVLRALTGDGYPEFVAYLLRNGYDEWDVGIAP